MGSYTDWNLWRLNAHFSREICQNTFQWRSDGKVLHLPRRMKETSVIFSVSQTETWQSWEMEAEQQKREGRNVTAVTVKLIFVVLHYHTSWLVTGLVFIECNQNSHLSLTINYYTTLFKLYLFIFPQWGPMVVPWSQRDFTSMQLRMLNVTAEASYAVPDPGSQRHPVS